MCCFCGWFLGHGRPAFERAPRPLLQVFGAQIKRARDIKSKKARNSTRPDRKSETFCHLIGQSTSDPTLK